MAKNVDEIKRIIIIYKMAKNVDEIKRTIINIEQNVHSINAKHVDDMGSLKQLPI